MRALPVTRSETVPRAETVARTEIAGRPTVPSRSRRRPYAGLVANFLADVVAVPLGSRRFRPLMTNFYVTKRCNLRCRYCYPPGDEPELPIHEVLRLLDKIRPKNPALNITGGEPLMYRDIASVLRRAADLGFAPLLLSTNGLLLERVVDELGLVDHVVISLDSLSRAENEQMTQVEGCTARIVRSIERCSELARVHGFELTLHSVLAPETLAGIDGILSFCEEVGASLSVSPEHGRYRPNPDLVGNREYEELVDRLLEWKRAGRPVFCSNGYLRVIRDFRAHRCFPFVSPRVEPDGRVYLPCQRIMDRHVYLQDYPSLVELMQREAEWITDPVCTERCFLACYVEVEQYLRNPIAALTEMSMRRTIAGRQR